MNISFKLKYEADGKQFTADSVHTEHFSLNVKNADNKLNVTINPKTELKITEFTVKYPYCFKSNDRIFVNGYQSWTDSLEYEPDGQMQEFSKLAEFLYNKSPLKHAGNSRSGDSLFHKFPRQSGIFYGWSYSYVRNGNHVDLFGSLNERCGYTIITFNTKKNCVFISKDLDGVTYSGETELLSFTLISDEYDNAFDLYFEQMGVQCREKRTRVGYSTWYNYYSNINEKVVLRDLNSISKLDTKIDCFQIDDGYQNAIGDWLVTDKKKFPSGMKNIADRIHQNDMLAGLWLAPFAGTKSSKLYKEHKDWFIQDENGRPYKTGHNWGGFYSLDIYNPDVRVYLKHVFDVVLNDWGYDLVKLDFLYGACVLPMHNKSRGEIMCDAMDLLRECCGDKLILGCGVPMMPAFGKVDYCRIGSDTSFDWKPKKHATREDVTLPHAVCNTVFRRHLDGRAWMNDPDVFLLRDNNIKINFEQRKLLAKIDSVFGSLLLISDNIAEYNSAQLKVLNETFSQRDIKIHRAEFVQKDTVIKNTVDFLLEYGFDGVSYDWEYPNKQQWVTFSEHLVNLKKALSEHNLLLSCAVSPWNFYMEEDAVNALDQIEIMSYDLCDENGNHSSFASGAVQPVQYFLNKGFKPEQINLGLPFYARPDDGGGIWINFDDSAYTLADRFQNYSDGMWFSGTQMIMDKTAYAIENNLGGIMIFTATEDVPYSNELSLLKSVKTTIDTRTTLGDNAKEDIE